MSFVLTFLAIKIDNITSHHELPNCAEVYVLDRTREQDNTIHEVGLVSSDYSLSPESGSDINQSHCHFLR